MQSATSESPQQGAAEQGSALEVLSAIDARILGCLIEKAAITPEVYPLTQNALVAACNQKTSRDPIMQLEPGAVGHAVRDLETRGLVKVAASSQRALRYEHRFDERYATTPRQRALLCALLLRGPQTLNELATRSERLADFPALDDVRDTIERLTAREPAYVIKLGRGAHQREDRYMHLLCGNVDISLLDSVAEASADSRAGLKERVDQLEADVAALRDEIASLREASRGGSP